MAKIIPTVLMTAATAVIFASVADAAPAKRRPRPKATAPAKPKLSDTDILVGGIAANEFHGAEALASCRPQDFKMLAVALNINRDWLTREQGEFETTEAYSASRAKLADALNKTPIVICEDLSDNEDAPFKYDADRQRFEGSFASTHNVWRDSKNLGTYSAKTRMGIPMTVKASADFEYDISLEIVQTMPGCISASYLNTYFVPVPLADAPLTKAVGKIAYVVRLAAPYVSYKETPGDPSLDNPYDVHTFGISVTARLEKILVVGAGGKPLWQCVVGKLLPLQDPVPREDNRFQMSYISRPYNAWRENPSGPTVASLQINREGAVMNCTVTSSSGSAILDNAACDAWKQKGKFFPASDAEGDPIDGSATVSHKW